MKLSSTSKKKLKRNFKFFSSILVSILPFILFIILTFSIITLLASNVSPDIFELKTFSDLFILFMWGASGVFPLISFLAFRKRKKYSPLNIILSTFSITLFILTLIPLFTPSSITERSLEGVIKTTYIFHISSMIGLTISFFISIYLTRKTLSKTNWWAFAVSIPYVLLGWIVQKDFTNFNNLVNLPEFSYKTLSQLLKDIHGSTFLINELWFKMIATLIFILIIKLGLIIVEKIWNKTTSWRYKINYPKKEKEIQ
ncbi:TPA: hypothetical protein ACQJHO_000843 [Enterococcus faecium]